MGKQKKFQFAFGIRFYPKINQIWEHQSTTFRHFCCYYNQWMKKKKLRFVFYFKRKTIVALHFPHPVDGQAKIHTQNCLNNRNCDGNEIRMCTISIYVQAYTITLQLTIYLCFIYIFFSLLRCTNEGIYTKISNHKNRYYLMICLVINLLARRFQFNLRQKIIRFNRSQYLLK